MQLNNDPFVSSLISIEPISLDEASKLVNSHLSDMKGRGLSERDKEIQTIFKSFIEYKEFIKRAYYSSYQYYETVKIFQMQSSKDSSHHVCGLIMLELKDDEEKMDTRFPTVMTVTHLTKMRRMYSSAANSYLRQTGSFLLERAIEEAKKLHIRKIDVVANNENARQFFERHGFKNPSGGSTAPCGMELRLSYDKPSATLDNASFG